MGSKNLGSTFYQSSDILKNITEMRFTCYFNEETTLFLFPEIWSFSKKHEFKKKSTLRQYFSPF